MKRYDRCDGALDSNLHKAQCLLKSVLALSIGLFGILVASGNILDYSTNWQFVQHVLSMDTMEPWFNGEALKERAITDLRWQQAAYVAIITMESVFGMLCSIGGLHMFWGTITGRSSIFAKGKLWFIFGCIPAILVWYTGFAVIGGEYFAMWGNKWNAQTKAYTFICFILLSLIYVSQSEAESK